MANLKEDSALNALNEKDYINKLYDNNTESAKKLLQESYTDNTGYLNNEQNRVEQQTAENVNRTQVEAQAAQNNYTGPKLSYGASQQEALSRSNAQQANITDLQQKQSEADAEIERQRQLLGSQYAAAIKQAQANNDMAKAQEIYNAAKAEEAKLLALKQNASTMLAKKGDTSIRDSLLAGETPTADYSGQTWEEVLKNEEALNEIYDKQLEAERLGLQTDYEETVSDLEAKRQQRQAQTDKALTDTYVDALQKMKNYAEVQTAYGQVSGTAGAARIAQDTELQKALTDLRGVQMGADAGMGMEGLDIGKTYREQLASREEAINRNRAEELLKAAEQEEENLYNIQNQIGQELAAKKDYSVLGKLYGLTQDQIDRLQGTGKYKKKKSSNGSAYKPQNLVMEAAQIAKKYGTEIANAYVNSQKVSQAEKNAANANAAGVAMTEYYKNRVVK